MVEAREGRGAVAREALTRDLTTCTSDSCCPFRVPKRGHQLARVLPSFPRTLRETTELSVARVSKFSGLRSPRKVLGSTRRGTTTLCNTSHYCCDIGKDATKLLATVSTTIPRNKGLVLTHGYRGTICRDVCLQQLAPICLCPSVIPKASLTNALAGRRVRTTLVRGPSTSTILLASPACSKVATSVTPVTRAIRQFKGVLVMSTTRKTRFKFRPKFPGDPITLKTSLAVMDLRGAVPYLARATLLLRGNDQIDARQLQLFRKVCRADSPSCLVVTTVSSYVSVIGGRNTKL